MDALHFLSASLSPSLTHRLFGRGLPATSHPPIRLTLLSSPGAPGQQDSPSGTRLRRVQTRRPPGPSSSSVPTRPQGLCFGPTPRPPEPSSRTEPKAAGLNRTLVVFLIKALQWLEPARPECFPSLAFLRLSNPRWQDAKQFICKNSPKKYCGRGGGWQGHMGAAGARG